MEETYLQMRKGLKAYMNEAEGVVKEVRGYKAWVITKRKSFCSHCIAWGFCELHGGGKDMVSEVTNQIGAKADDKVRIGIPKGSVAKASMIVYMIPVIGLVGGGSIAYYFGNLFSLDLNISALIGSLSGMGIAMITLRFLNGILSKKSSYQPDIISIIDPGGLRRPASNSHASLADADV